MAHGKLGALFMLCMAAIGCADGASPADGGSEFPPGYECLANTTLPDAPAPSFEASLRFYQINPDWDPLTNVGTLRLPIEGLVVDVCESPPDCPAPYDTGVTDALGDVTLTIPTPGKGFPGALRLSAPGFITLYYVVYPPVRDAQDPWYANVDHMQPIYTPATLAQRLAVLYDPTKSSITVGTADCVSLYDDAVSVTIDDGQAPTLGTGSSVFFLNIEPGTHRVDAVLVPTGQPLASVDVIVPQGEMAAVHLGPIPPAR